MAPRPQTKRQPEGLVVATWDDKTSDMSYRGGASKAWLPTRCVLGKQWHRCFPLPPPPVPVPHAVLLAHHAETWPITPTPFVCSWATTMLLVDGESARACQAALSSVPPSHRREDFLEANCSLSKLIQLHGLLPSVYTEPRAACRPLGARSASAAASSRAILAKFSPSYIRALPRPSIALPIAQAGRDSILELDGPSDVVRSMWAKAQLLGSFAARGVSSY